MVSARGGAGMMGNADESRRPAQKTLLVVEDNELNAKLYRDLLQAEGHRVVETNDGREVVEIARRIKPDLIVMDIQLPCASGLEITKCLKQDEALKEIPVIAVTSFAMKGDEEKIREGGCDAYMAIPISVVQFLETINRLPGIDPSPEPAALRMARPQG
jgi:two-component system cell cycle response regulator DivK